MAAPLITRTPIHDDDGSGTTGTIIDNAWKQELYNQIDADVAAIGGAAYSVAAEVLSVSAAGNIALSAGYLTHIVQLTPPAGASWPITWSGGAGINGERLILFGRTAGICTVANGGIVFNIATSAPTPIAFNGVAVYTQYSGVWVLTSHEQGQAITPPFGASNFYGSGSMTWTVASAGAIMSYKLRGNSLTLNFQISGSIGGTGAASLFINNAAWGGFSGDLSRTSVTSAPFVYDGGGAFIPAAVIGLASAGAIYAGKYNQAAWIVSATMYLYGQTTIEVT